MATLKARERTNLTANSGVAPPPPQRTSSFNGGRRSSAPSSPQGSISSFNARRSSAPPSPQRARRSSAPTSPQRTSSFNGRRSPRPSTPENPLPPVGADKLRYNHLKARPATPVNAPKSATKSLQPTSTASTKRLPITKPATEKPPSPYAAPRQFTSLKSSLEKVPKILTGAKTGQLARTRSLGSARAATSIPPRIIGSSIPVPKFAGGNKTGQLSRTMSLGSTAIETWGADGDIDEELVVGMQTEQEQSHIAAPKQDEEQDAADSTLTEPLELNSDAEEVIDGSMQLQEEEEEEQAQEVGTESGVVVGEEEEDSKINEAEDTFESKSNDGAEDEPAKEQASEEAMPAKFVRSMSTVAATKKETLISHNDVIEEAKSKLLEKRKNRVLALVGAFETVMALQEPDGQPGQG